MKFVKGFLVTIALYLGLSIGFQVIMAMMAGIDIAALFTNTSTLPALFYGFLAVPTATSVYMMILIPDPDILVTIVSILGVILPAALAAVIGSIVEKKSGQVKYVFLSTFAGLLTCAGIGIVLLFALSLPVALSLIASFLSLAVFNAFLWGSVGLLATAKKWD